MEIITTKYTGAALALDAGRLIGVEVLHEPTAVAAKRSHLEALATIQRVETLEEEAAAVAFARETKAFLKEIESDREFIKKPIAALAKQIDEFAKSYRFELEQELDRISKLVSARQVKEREKLAEAERIRQEAIRDAAATAEKARLAALEQQEIANATANVLTATAAPTGLTQEDRDRIELENNLAAQAADHAAEQQKEMEAVIRAPLPVASRATGMRVLTPWKYEVLNIEEVYAARPDLCTLEINKGVMRSVIGEKFSCPGIRIWQETNTSFVA